MINIIVERLESIQKKVELRKERKRKERIRYLLLELYRINGVYKVPVHNLQMLQIHDTNNNIEYKWMVDYNEEFIN